MSNANLRPLPPRTPDNGLPTHCPECCTRINRQELKIESDGAKVCPNCGRFYGYVERSAEAS